ncbi:endonuclease/exonuclease/phosphatase family protein [Lacticaseibacillus jixiensis]|uniref:endonuclease/exonuclease/phosphatase family protein n=1 Tax=Lacticaseibacillus jixiensis TaxID=3231926 RepID=UPI0036F303AC
MRVNIATFNVAGGRQPDCEAINRLCRRKQVNILGAQEVDVNTTRMPLDMPKRIAGADYQYEFAASMPLLGGAYGLALFADQALTDSSVYRYAAHGDEPRICQHAVYNQTLSLYHTHLSFESEAIRRQQVAALKQLIATDPLPAKVVLGDFNMDQSHAEWQAFQPDWCLLNGDGGQWFETFSWRDPTMRVFAIDNILLSPAVHYHKRWVADTILSDHQMLIGEIDY